MMALPFLDRSHQSTADRVETFVRAHIAPLAGNDESSTNDSARQYVRLLAHEGWLQLIDPSDIRTACLIRERLAYVSSLADSMFAMQGLGGLPIAMYGTQQQQVWFSRINDGAIGAFALTEPDAGSDPAGMKLEAIRDGDEYRLTGEKTFIS